MVTFSAPFCDRNETQRLGAALEALVAKAKPMAECATFAEVLDNLVPGLAPSDGSFGVEAEQHYVNLCWRKRVRPRRKIEGSQGASACYCYNPIWRIVYYDPETMMPVGACIRFLDNPTIMKVIRTMPKNLYDMGAHFTIDEVEIRVPAK